LSVPMKVISLAATTNGECDLVVSVFHHPYPWLQADIAIAFRDHIEHNCDVVLTGHQHYDHAYVKQSLPTTGFSIPKGTYSKSQSHPNAAGSA